MQKVINVFLIGPMGAGKSTIGRTLAKELKFEFYDSDEVVEQRAGADISWIFDIEGEQGFREREQRVITELTKHTHIVLATGGGAVLSAKNRTALASRGTVVYLRTSLKQQLERTRRDTKRPLLRTDDIQGKLTQLVAEREPYYLEIADMSINTDDLSVKSITQQIIENLEKL